MRLSEGLHRRALLALALPALALPALALSGALAGSAMAGIAPDFAAIERATGGKLGVFVLDTGSSHTLAWRADERFPFCSSMKAPLAAYVLYKVDRGDLRLDQRIRYGQADLLSYYAPITRKHLSQGAMTVEALCAAAVDYSDNIAANLLLRETGGPAALTAWMRASGDQAFQLTNTEPKLNRARLGEAQDTTTPRAMAASFRRFALGDRLSPASRALFTDWLVANTTGDKRIRAGLPAGWRVGDKTGTWNEGWFSTIDIAIAWPPGRAPVILSGFVTDHPSTAAGEAALAEVARQTAAWITARG